MFKNSFKIKNLKLKIILALLFVLITSNFSLITPKAHAATLGMSSDTISTSRPSASSVLLWNQPAASTSAILFDNGSIFLASDSAKFHPNPNQTITVASSSAYGTNPVKRLISFTSAITDIHNKGHALIVPITAAHAIQFTVINPIPANGQIVLTFPALTSGDANNAASPSATTFQLNNVVSGTGGRDYIDLLDDNTDITTSSTITSTAPSSGTSPIITIQLNSSTSIAAGSVVKILLGCTANSGGICTTQAPMIINPSKTAVPGVADQSTSGWSLKVNTIDTSTAQNLDQVVMKIGTVDSVFVSATVDPSLTFTITGLAGSTALNSQNPNCGAESTSVGATSTIVDLGTLSSSSTSLAAQEISVTTNAQFGYVITATSSGRFINPANGFFLVDANDDGDTSYGLESNDTPAPAAFSAGTPKFGISPCGSRVSVAVSPGPDWGETSAKVTDGTALLSNPWNTGTGYYHATLANYSGPIGVSADKTVIRYGASIASTTPAGLYSTTFTYVITPTF